MPGTSVSTAQQRTLVPYSSLVLPISQKGQASIVHPYRAQTIPYLEVGSDSDSRMGTTDDERRPKRYYLRIAMNDNLLDPTYLHDILVFRMERIYTIWWCARSYRWLFTLRSSRGSRLHHGSFFICGEPVGPRYEDKVGKFIRLILCEKALGFHSRYRDVVTHIVEGPLDFFGQHFIHWRNDLDGHVNEPFAEHKANMIVILCKPSRTNE